MKRPPSWPEPEGWRVLKPTPRQVRVIEARAAACDALAAAQLHTIAAALLLGARPTHESLKRAARSAVYKVMRGYSDAEPALEAVIALAAQMDAAPFIRSIIGRERERVERRDSGAGSVVGATGAKPKCRTGKHGYTDETAARERLAKLAPVSDPNFGAALDVYRCSICNQHHVGRASAGAAA